MRPDRCQACGGARLGFLNRLHEYLCAHSDDEPHEGVWISVLPHRSRLMRMIGGREIGELGALICVECGLVELYVKESDQVPWDRDPDFKRLPDYRCIRCGEQRAGQLGTVHSRMINVAYIKQRRRWPLSFLPPYLEPVGAVTGLVCTDCGYVITYVRGPRTFPWARLEGFERREPGATRCAVCGGGELGDLASLGDQHATLALYKVRWYQQGVGRLRAVVCVTCGHYRAFLRDPEQMEWPGIPDFAWLGPG